MQDVLRIEVREVLRPNHLPPDAELVAYVREWLDFAGHDRLEAACELLDGPSRDGVDWSAQRIREHVADVFGPGTIFRRTHPGGPAFSAASEAAGNPHVYVTTFADGSGYLVDHDVPLNGSFSDLTAEFEFLWDDDVLKCSLRDLHIM